MSNNFLVNLEYDGSRISGATNIAGQITAYSLIKNALSTIAGEQNASVRWYCRTDKHVHAIDQVCSITINNLLCSKAIQRIINNYCRNSGLIVKRVVQTKRILKFTDINYRTYTYRLADLIERTVFNEKYISFYPNLPSLYNLRSSCLKVCEEVFNLSDKTFMYCTVGESTISSCIDITIKASGFKRSMIRNIVFSAIKQCNKENNRIYTEKLSASGLYLIDVGISQDFLKECIVTENSL